MAGGPEGDTIGFGFFFPYLAESPPDCTETRAELFKKSLFVDLGVKSVFWFYITCDLTACLCLPASQVLETLSVLPFYLPDLFLESFNRESLYYFFLFFESPSSSIEMI